MSASNIIILILIIVVLFLALWVRSLEKTLELIESTVLTLMSWHEKQVKFNDRTTNRLQSILDWREEQGKINDRLLQWCKNTDKSLDDMLETQAKLVEMGNETYTKYLEHEVRINGIKFEMEQKDLVTAYCANDALATAAVVIDEEEEE